MKNELGKYIKMENKFLSRWLQLEANEKQPRYMNNLIEIEFDELRAKVLAQETDFVNYLVDSLWSGDIYLVKRAFTRDWVASLKDKVIDYFDSEPESFHSILENCPDFHRKIDPDIAKKYSVDAVRHTAYFFPWNNDRSKIFHEIWERWGVYKQLGGFDFDQYVKNTPIDGVIDRIQVCLYGSGSGGLSTHSDPYLNQRVIISGYLSERGDEFHDGGFYAVDQKGSHFDLENKIEIGDMGFGYATVLHGVKQVESNIKSHIKYHQGRWFLGLYSIDSNEKKNRHTSALVK